MFHGILGGLILLVWMVGSPIVASAALFAYVTNSGTLGNTVTVIDINTFTITQVITVEENPAGVAITPDGRRAYVTNYNSDSVSVIDTINNRVIATIRGLHFPNGVISSPDGTAVYVVNLFPSSVSIIDTTTNAIIGNIAGENVSDSIAITPDGRRLYVTNQTPPSVFVIDTKSKTLIDNVPITGGGFPRDLAITPNGNKVYVTQPAAVLSHVIVIDAITNSVEQKVRFLNSPLRVAITPDETQAYVTDSNPNIGEVSVIDIATDTVIATIPVGLSPNAIAIADVPEKTGFTQSMFDAFNRSSSTSLGPDWNEYMGNLEIFNGEVRNSTTNNKAAIFTRAAGPDQAVSVDCKVTGVGNSCGVMARWSSESNFYRARLDFGAQDVALFKTVNGITTRLGVFSRPLSFDTSYRVRLVIRGPKLSVYFANERTPGISISDNSLPSGDFAGIRSYAASVYATVFDNFDVTTPLVDTFNRPNSTNLGANWSEYLPDLEISNGEVRNVNGGGQSKAARYLVSVGPDQDVAVDCKLIAIGNSCGVMARWSSANNFYHVRMDVGAQNVALFKTVNGVTTKLGQFNRALKLSAYYRLKLIIKGNNLSVLFGNESAVALSVLDSALTLGTYAGIRSYATVADMTYLNNFRVTVAP